LEAGVDLLDPASAFGLAAQGGLVLARLERTQEYNAVATPVGLGTRLEPLGSSWESAASVGLEGSFRAGAFGMALSLVALVPLSPEPRGAPPQSSIPSDSYVVIVTSPPATPRPTGLGETFGGELRLRLWVAPGG
jgi:hypothetical protein